MQQPLGEKVDWTPAQRPIRGPLRGSHVLARPFLPDADAQPLYAASHPPEGDLATWTYLPDGPYDSVEQLRGTLEWAAAWEDAVYFALAPLPEERPLGMAAYLNITPESGVVEIGHVWFGAGLKRTTAATEAIYLLVQNAFDELGYRRVEWKCNALNAASRRAVRALTGYPAVCSRIAPLSCGHSGSGRSCPMSSTSSRRAPGTSSAVRCPPLGAISVSSRPWITSVGT
jgi:RimJ/RimL family protein N-acetyltransferase